MDAQPSDSYLPPDVVRQINILCAQFEEALREQKPLDPARLLERVPPVGRGPLLRDLLLAVLEHRGPAHRDAVLADWRRRFPQYPNAIKAAEERTARGDGPGPDTEGPRGGAPPGSDLPPTGAYSLLADDDATGPAPGPVGVPPPAKRRAESTEASAAVSIPAAEGPGPRVPERIGRYAIERVLGAGAFGTVYLARDDELRRPVAIKVQQLADTTGTGLERYVREARVLASLEHPAIVPVYDVGRTDDGLCYIVSKLIPGRNLAEILTTTHLSLYEKVAVVAQVAEALDYAHTRHVVHRDIKPANLLLDRQGHVFVSDFGLAMTRKDDERAGAITGTIPYMSPEQARGDTEQIDGRSDIFSLGIVFYELLTGSRPFTGKTKYVVLEQILNADPPVPAYRDHAVPNELTKICLKCLEKLPGRRYSSAMQLARALRRWQKTGAAAPKLGNTALRIVPERLQPFGGADADLYAELQFGEKGSASLPEPLAFWAAWARGEGGARPDGGHRLGLVAGPAGSGKSSFVRAGVLPCLGKEVLSLYVAADDAEAALRAGLRRLRPALPAEVPLADAVRGLQRGPLPRGARKVLIVLDQFERWLWAHPSPPETELAAALGCCDGERFQALLVVREEFRAAAKRLLTGLGVALDARVNFAVVNNLELARAERLFIRMGQAWSCLPAKLADIASQQATVVQGCVSYLSSDGRVCPVRLAQVALTLRPWAWKPATFSRVGGARGALVEYVDDRLRGPAGDGDPEPRLRAARALVEALLPPPTYSVRHHARSREELLAAAGYAADSAEGAALLTLLEQEMRLIVRAPPGHEAAGTSLFRLEDDPIAEVLREWLARRSRRQRGAGPGERGAGRGPGRGSIFAGGDDDEAAQGGSRWDLVLPTLRVLGTVVAGVCSASCCALFPLALVVAVAGFGTAASARNRMVSGEWPAKWLLFLAVGLATTFGVQAYLGQGYLGPVGNVAVWWFGGRPRVAQNAPATNPQAHLPPPRQPRAPFRTPPVKIPGRAAGQPGTPPPPPAPLDPLERFDAARPREPQEAERNRFIREDLPRVLEEHPELKDQAAARLAAILADPAQGDPAPAARALDALRLPDGSGPLQRALKADGPQAWGNAWKALLRLDPGSAPATVPALVDHLSDTSPESRAQAAEFLGQIGPPARAALGPLLRCLEDDGLEVRERAFGALLAIDPGGAARSVPGLVKVLGADGEAPGARGQAARCLGKLGLRAGPAAVRALLAAVDDPNTDVAEAAFAAVQEIHPALRAAAVRQVTRRLGDADSARRTQAARFIGQLPEAARPLTVGPLIDVMNEKGGAGRDAAFELLKAMPDELLALRIPKLVETLRFRPASAHLAAELLGGLGRAARDAVPALVANLGDPDARLSTAAADALGKIGPPAVPALLEALRRSRNPAVRRAAAGLLGAAKDERAVAPLVAALNDAAFDVRKTAWRSLTAIDPEFAPARATPAVGGLASQLTDDRPEEQAWAAATLGEIGPGARQATPALEKLINKEETPTSVRAAAREALDKIKAPPANRERP